MAMNSVNFDQLITFTRPSSAPYRDAGGVAQTAAADEVRRGYNDGEFEGFYVDSLLDEKAEIASLPNFSTEEGAFVFTGTFEDVLFVPGLGFTEILTGEGTIAFSYNNGVGKCWADGAVMFTDTDMSVSLPSALVGGGFAKIKGWEYVRNVPESVIANKTQGTFSLTGEWSFDADYAAGVYKSRKADGTIKHQAFDEEHTFSRPSVKNVWNALGVNSGVAADQPAINHDPASLRSSATELSARPGIKTFSVDASHDYAVGETLVLTDGAGGRSLTGEVLAADGLQVSIMVPLRGVTGYGTGSAWAVIRPLGIWPEPTAANYYTRTEDMRQLNNAAVFDVEAVPSIFESGSIAARFTRTVVDSSGRTPLMRTVFESDGGVHTASVILELFILNVVAFSIYDDTSGAFASYSRYSLSDGLFGEMGNSSGALEPTYEAVALGAGPNGGTLVRLVTSSDVVSGNNMSGIVYADYDNQIGNSAIIHHIQIEPGSISTSPILTGNDAVIRAADVMTLEDLVSADWWSGSSGWFVIDVTLLRNNSQDGILRSEGGQRIIYNNAGFFRAYDGETLTRLDAPIEVGQRVVLCVTWDGDAGQLKMTSSEEAPSVKQSPYSGSFSSITQMPVMSNEGDITNSHVSRLRYGKGFLSDEQMREKVGP